MDWMIRENMLENCIKFKSKEILMVQCYTVHYLAVQWPRIHNVVRSLEGGENCEVETYWPRSREEIMIYIIVVSMTL